MNNIPDKIYYHLGYNNLGLILDQDMKHWLMKVNKQIQTQDINTGSVFVGKFDNTGSDVVLETQKSPITHNGLVDLNYVDDGAQKIFEKSLSAFPFSISVKGLLFARITSIAYPVSKTSSRSYRLKLVNCEKCILPFAVDTSSGSLFADRWLKTTSTPILQVMDSLGEYTIEVPLTMNNCTNGVYYFPLNETLQTVSITEDNDAWYTDAVNNNDYIGLPLYWFECDEVINGPSISISNNHSTLGKELVQFGTPGNVSKYHAQMFVGVDGNNDDTPDDSLTSDAYMVCSPLNGSFTNTPNDVNIDLDPSLISMVTTETFPLGLSFNGERSRIRIHDLTNWEYVDENTYRILMSNFDDNCIDVSRNALTPIFDIDLDTTIPFENTDYNDIGFAGIQMSTADGLSDNMLRYPYDLSQWDGLPEWINELDENGNPQHMAIYAIHNTPTYTPSNPDSRQTAALLIDSGKKKTDDSEELTNDERGRVYVISNDDTTYRNNLVEKMNEGLVKPDRTVARICDIPTSVMELSGISGLFPSPVVDKKYVRTEANFSELDKNRLWNVVNWQDRWVRPTAKDVSGIPISTYGKQNGDEYVFNSSTLLNQVDMYIQNNFRVIENLNPSVQPDQVTVSSIIDGGSNYSITDKGKIIIGGFSFTYEVENVDDNGAVTEVAIGADYEQPINMSNFDMLSGNSGITETYGTAPLDPNTSGTGLKVKLLIENYDALLPYKGDFLDLIHAFVREDDGIWLYEFTKPYNSDTYGWSKATLVSPYENSSPSIDKGLSSSDAYMASIIPNYTMVNVCAMKNNVAQKRIKTFSTPTFINIVDDDHTPLTPNSSSSQDDESTISRVDLCKFSCRVIKTGVQATNKTFAGMLNALKTMNVLQYDCYVMWKWDNPNDERNLSFSYGIITRSLNNYVSSDVTTKLPINKLRYDRYVNTNIGTTVVWDAPGLTGVMMWIYDPTSTTIEKYVVDPSTQNLYANKQQSSWKDIDIFNSDVHIVNDEGIFEWNIMTNSQAAIPSTTTDPIYQQPEFRNIITIGTSIETTHPLPMGNWKLVFPMCESFTLKNVTNGTTYKPVHLQMLRGENLGQLSDVFDENGNTVNAKTLILDQTPNGTTLNVFNETTGSWEKI